MDQKVGDGDGTDRISHLPKDILYHILYFLSKREAARTCVLSKSWRFLWAKRLTVSFSERSSLFNGPHPTPLFVTRVSNALQVHLDHNHRVEDFRLVLIDPKSIPLLEKWIPMLTAIGVKELCLSILPQGSRRPTASYVDLPSVLFKAKSLTHLHLFRCNLARKSISPDRKILFDRLKVLRLRNVHFTDKHIFNKIISSCPLITTMLFQECQGLKTIKLVDDDKKLHKCLKHFTFINEQRFWDAECSIEDAIPTLETIHIVGSKIRFHGHKFDNLKKLSLYLLKFSGNSFDCSVCYEFPCLGSLHLVCCKGWEEFDQLIRINAPNLLTFLYGSSFCTIPSITFTTPMSRQCKSYIHLRFRDDPQSWFLKLRGLLQVLSQSDIRLRVKTQNLMHNIDLMSIEQDLIDNLSGGNCEAPAVVEEMKLNMGQYLSSFLKCMLSICRPRIVIAEHSYVRGGESGEERDHKELTEFLCKLVMKRSDSGEFTRQEDLEEVSAECFDKSRKQWQPTMMSECAALPKSKSIRFLLKWSEAEAACESSSKRRKLE